VYGIHDYDAMFTDPVRTPAYLTAIARTVRPGDVVVEIGTGVGFFAVAACRAGAKHVYAIEVNPAAALAHDVLAANGCADRVTVIRERSNLVTLPERGDVLLEDLRGVLPLLGDHIPTVRDARERLLRPGATIIPFRDTLWAAPVEADAKFREAHIDPGDAPFGIQRGAIAAHVRNDWYRLRCNPAQLAAPPVQWGAIEYGTVESPDLSGRPAWQIAREATVDGICVWFDAELTPDTTFSNAPAAANVVYAQAFFPLERSIAVRPGDALHTDFAFKLAAGEYVCAWNTVHVPAAGSDREPSAFQQSNLHAATLAKGELRRRRDDYRPVPSADMWLAGELLTLTDGSRSLGEIAAAIVERHPHRFATVADALGYCARCLEAFENLGDGHGR
jgi:hypothetical protein